MADEPGCECQMKFALMLSTLDFDSAIRGYLTTPLALRFLGSRRNAGQGVVEGARRGTGHPGAPCISAAGEGAISLQDSLGKCWTLTSELG